MVSGRRKRRHDTSEEARDRVIAETSAYLTECLRHPELAVRIPVIPCGRGRFPRSLTIAFWAPVLNE